MGELSAARQALEGASFAPGNLATLGMLTDPTRRPPVPRSALSQEVRDTEPAEPVALDPLEFLTCLWKARRGAAAGPSGMTSDHFFPMLENEGDSQLLVEVASALGMARVPEEISLRSAPGVGAYDLISRNAMLEGLLRMESGDQILPFVRMFYSNLCGKMSLG